MKVSSRLSRSFPVLSLTAACVLAFAACSSSNSGGGTGGSSGSGTGGSNTGTGGSNPGTGGSNTGTGGSSTGSGGSNTGSGGTVSTGGTTGSGGSNTGTGGSNTGTGGTNTGSGGTTGTGGSNNGGHGGGSAGSGGSSTGGSTGTGGGSGACPANATFCSGFETNALPTGATYSVNAAPGDWSRDFAVDTTQKHSGNSSLLVKKMGAPGTSGSSYLMLAVPAPSGAFWVRFYVQSDMPMGGIAHNAFAGTSPSTDPNAVLDQFAEDVGISFHTSDSDVTWPTGYGRLTSGATNPYALPAMTWKCVEISYDLTNRHQQLYIDGTQLIDATNYPPAASYSGTFSTFKFGFYGYNGPARQMWYDDVVVAPNRVGCQ